MIHHTKRWTLLITAIMVSILLLNYLLYGFLSNQIQKINSDTESYLFNDLRIEELKKIPVRDLLEYSEDFDYTVQRITNELPVPLNKIMYESIDKKTMGNIRREMTEMDFSSLYDIIPYILQSASNFIKRFSLITSILVITISLALISVLRLSEMDERRKMRKEEKAKGERKVLL